MIDAGADSAGQRLPTWLRPLLAGIDRLGRLDGWLGAICLIALTLFLLLEVLLRAVSRLLPWAPHSVPVAWEYSSYLMAATFTFGAAMTLRAGGHIRVTLLLGRLAPTVRRIAEAAAAAIGTAMTGFLALAMLRFTIDSYVREQVSIQSFTPLWIPQSVVTFGIVLLALQFLARFLLAAFGEPVEDHSLRPGALAE